MTRRIIFAGLSNKSSVAFRLQAFAIFCRIKRRSSSRSWLCWRCGSITSPLLTLKYAVHVFFLNTSISRHHSSNTSGTQIWIHRQHEVPVLAYCTCPSRHNFHTQMSRSGMISVQQYTAVLENEKIYTSSVYQLVLRWFIYPVTTRLHEIFSR